MEGSVANEPELSALRRALLAWYDQNGREMPWRQRGGSLPDPYHVLVSEAMLQQTQVATVIPYFNRFIRELPTLAALAAAPEQQVLRLWQGLGYYTRARSLRAAAVAVLQHFGGTLPRTAEELRQLPGVGPYTAGAIASIAFNQPAAILDGNVARVLSRLWRVTEPIDQPAVRARLWELAQASVDPQRPGDFNQAVMDLGALVCTPKAPACLTCPLYAQCAAAQAGEAEALPARLPRKAPRAVTHLVLALHRRDTWLLERRPARGMWANLWQFPTSEDEVPHLVGWALAHLGLKVAAPAHLGGFTQQTTHRTIRFEVHQAQVIGGRLRPKAGVWRKLGELQDLPMANPQQHVAQLLRNARARG